MFFILPAILAVFCPLTFLILQEIVYPKSPLTISSLIKLWKALPPAPIISYPMERDHCINVFDTEFLFGHRLPSVAFLRRSVTYRIIEVKAASVSEEFATVTTIAAALVLLFLVFIFGFNQARLYKVRTAKHDILNEALEIDEELPYTQLRGQAQVKKVDTQGHINMAMSLSLWSCFRALTNFSSNMAEIKRVLASYTDTFASSHDRLMQKVENIEQRLLVKAQTSSELVSLTAQLRDQKARLEQFQQQQKENEQNFADLKQHHETALALQEKQHANFVLLLKQQHEDAMEQLSANHTATQKQNDALVTAAATTEAAQLKALSEAEELSSVLQEEVKALGTKLELSQDRVASLENENSRIGDATKDAEQENKRLSRNLEKALDMQAELKNTADVIEEENSDLRTQLRNAEVKLVGSDRQGADFRKEKLSLQAALTAARTLSEQKQSNITKLESKVGKLELELEESQQRADSALKRVKAQADHTATVVNGRLQGELKDAKAVIEELQLKALMSKRDLELAQTTNDTERLQGMKLVSQLRVELRMLENRLETAQKVTTAPKEAPKAELEVGPASGPHVLDSAAGNSSAVDETESSSQQSPHKTESSPVVEPTMPSVTPETKTVQPSGSEIEQEQLSEASPSSQQDVASADVAAQSSVSPLQLADSSKAAVSKSVAANDAPIMSLREQLMKERAEREARDKELYGADYQAPLDLRHLVNPILPVEDAAKDKDLHNVLDSLKEKPAAERALTASKHASSEPFVPRPLGQAVQDTRDRGRDRGRGRGLGRGGPGRGRGRGFSSSLSSKWAS